MRNGCCRRSNLCVYPYDYLCYRITDYRPTSFANMKLTGEQASHDLRLFVEDLTDAAAVPADAAGEEVLTVEEMAKRFNVSTKTISRWRQQGLVSRRFVFDGRKRLGFLRSSVDRFVGENTERVNAAPISARCRRLSATRLFRVLVGWRRPTAARRKWLVGSRRK